MQPDHVCQCQLWSNWFFKMQKKEIFEFRGTKNQIKIVISAAAYNKLIHEISFFRWRVCLNWSTSCLFKWSFPVNHPINFQKKCWLVNNSLRGMFNWMAKCKTAPDEAYQRLLFSFRCMQRSLRHRKSTKTKKTKESKVNYSMMN